MKKVAKKDGCIIAAVTAVLVIVCIFCFVRWERKSSDLSFQFEETTYTYKDEYYDVFKLVYLQMVGSRDKEKESKINRLIEDDVKKLMELAAPDEVNGYTFVIGTFHYEIEYADEKFISISYIGYAKYFSPGKGFESSMMATTIDCEEMKVLELKDVVSDLDGLCQMLMEDRFEHITAWEGRTGDYKMSDIYSYGDEDRSYLLLEELNGNDRDIEWYIKKRKMSLLDWWSILWGNDVDEALVDKDFVIVDLQFMGAGVAHNEFAIEMEQIRELLKEDFVKSML